MINKNNINNAINTNIIDTPEKGAFLSIFFSFLAVITDTSSNTVSKIWFGDIWFYINYTMHFRVVN